jgi:hypothetical protein
LIAIKLRADESRREMSDGGVSLDPPERTMGRRWLAVAGAPLVAGASAAQVVVPAAETSPASIAGIAPSYGPKTVSAVPNAAAIMRRIWLPGLDAGYDPQGLAVDGGAIYVSAYRSDSLGVRRGPCRVIRIDLETGGPADGSELPGFALYHDAKRQFCSAYGRQAGGFLIRPDGYIG